MPMVHQSRNQPDRASQSKMKTALAYSGAGANIIVEAGFAKAYRDSGLDYDYVNGTSSGAIVSAFVAANQVDDLEQLVLTCHDKDVFHFQPWRLFDVNSLSILSNTPLKQLLKKHLDCAAIRASGKSCTVNVSNLKTWSCIQYELAELSDDDIIQAIVMSTAIPIAFPHSKGLVDGGVLRDYPVLNAFAEKADRIVLFVPNSMTPAKNLNNIVDMINACVAAQLNNQLISLKQTLQFCPPQAEMIIIEPLVSTGIGLLNFDALGSVVKRQGYIDIGYKTAKAVLDRLKN